MKNRTIDMDDASAGMTLGAPVADGRGGVLLPKGAALTDSLLTALRRRGIEQLQVEDDSADSAEDAAAAERIRARLALVFRHAGDDPLAAQLLQAITEFRLEHRP